MTEKRTVMNKKDEMPKNWAGALWKLHTNDVRKNPLTQKEIREECQVGSDFFSALRNLGVLKTFNLRGINFPYVESNPSAKQIREQKWKDRKAQDERCTAALRAAVNEKRQALEDELDQCAHTITLAQAIEIITAAGGTVVFGDAQEQVNKAHAAKNMEAMARKKR